MILAVVSQKPKGMTLENILKAEKLKKKKSEDTRVPGRHLVKSRKT